MHESFLTLLQMVDSIESDKSADLTMLGVKITLIIFVLALFLGGVRAQRAKTNKRAVFLRGFLTIFVIALGLFVMLLGLAYLVGLQIY